MPVRSCASLALLVLLCSVPAAAQGERFRLDYRVYASGIQVMEVTALVELGAERYRLEVDARTQGLIGRLFSWHMVSRTAGRITGRGSGGGVEPEWHRARGEWRGRPRRVALDYGSGDGRIRVEAVPPAAREEREPVPPGLVRGTVDPLSAVAAMLVRLAAGEGCGGTVPVFDGRRRYDLSFRNAGTRDLARGGYSAFGGGTAMLCEVHSRMIAGRRLDRPREPSEPRRPGQVLLAPVAEGMPPLPVRLDVDAPFGSFIAHLDDFARLPAE